MVSLGDLPWDTASSGIRSLVPPRDPDDHQGNYRWRVAVSVSIAIALLAITSHIALACGWLEPVIGYPGFAKADVVQSINSRLIAMQASEIDSQIWRDRTEQCRALKGKDTSYMNLLAQRLTWEMGEYYALKSQTYSLPDCSVLGVGG